jgi:uncharacterized MAPEG superfamily protein
MSTELTMLTWSAVLALLIPLPYVVGAIMEFGLPRLAGNRDSLPNLEGFVGRGRRAHANLLESLAPFAALVLVAHLIGASNATTALGAQLFFWGRVGHAIVYYIGIPWVRTGMFAVSIVGCFMILREILAHTPAG